MYLTIFILINLIPSAVGTALTPAAFVYGDAWAKKNISYEKYPSLKLLEKSAYYGDKRFIIPASLGYLVYTHIKNDTLQKSYSEKLAYSVSGTFFITASLKMLFHRVRPNATTNSYDFKGPSISFENTSLPSGHTAIAFAFSTSLANSINGYKDDIILYSLATLTGISRIYTIDHWLSDVIIGYVIGYTTATLIHKYYK